MKRKILSFGLMLSLAFGGLIVSCNNSEDADVLPAVTNTGYNYIIPPVGTTGRIQVLGNPKNYSDTATRHVVSVAYDLKNSRAFDLNKYYSSAANLSGDVLKEKISQIISSGAKKLDYSENKEPDKFDVWDMCREGDQDPKNPGKVWLIYTEKSINKSFRSGSANGDSKWNREHVWAKSHGDFGTSNGPGTDGHHLRAADVSENGRRSNYDFAGEVGASKGLKNGYYTPPKSSRGDVARMILYMELRWNASHNLKVDDKVEPKNTDRARHGKLSDLLKWHNEDPVDPYEIRRNNVIFKYQGNRNPLVDHPELVEYIFGNKKGQSWDGGYVYSAN
ncbi:MAG: endonuclease [Cytophagales bacterium]|nr:endonuclease [Cytophagales bacterium]